MKTLLFFSALCYTLSATSTFAQGEGSLDWFPYKTGDMWEYVPYLTPSISDTAQIINIKDSVSADGRIHLTQQHRFINPVMDEYSFSYSIDTALGEVFGRSGELRNVRIYRFGVHTGDQWVMKAYEIGGYEMARVIEVGQGTFLGKNTTFMRIRYYATADSTDTLGLSRYWDKLAKGFGLVERFPSEGGDWYFLKGAVINGVLYGDTTRVVTTVDNRKQGLPKKFELLQNYPNPFNPKTTIEFSLPERELIRLAVFDVLGKEVTTLAQGVKEAGKYTIRFDASALQSGVYFYRLTAGGYTELKKMLVLK